MLEVKLAKPFDTEISSVTICASMSVGVGTIVINFQFKILLSLLSIMVIATVN